MPEQLKPVFHLKGRIWIEAQERFMGPGRVELLEKIAETGSINQAAKAMQMSYKKAWELVNSMNSQAEHPLVITQTGGEKGGGAAVTDEGRRYIAQYLQLQERFQVFLQQENQRLLE
ncbi:MAG: winged helix-turn-helix domain-containing protein [Spirosomataceae bacterium]